MEEKVLNAALAGLLHDVGKIEQRARSDPWNPAPGIESEGQPVHATWTTYFVQNYVPRQFQGAALAGAYHHSPEKSPAADPSLSKLVALADKLSAGERSDLSEDEKKPPKQMVTIFDRIALEGKGKQPGWHYLPLKPLELGHASLFPDQAVDDEKTIDQYLQLCEFLRSAAKQDTPDPETYLENYLGALQQAAWCVPSAYYHSLPDVSLYDHSRMTAALAVCLVDKPKDEITLLLEAVKQSFVQGEKSAPGGILEKEVAILVGGDISGVQDFIYTISSKGAAKTLRGRSFYLQLLTEAVLRFVLRELGLPFTNVIYAGGGHFFLLAPATAAGKIPELQRKVTQKLLEHHGTSLYLAIGYAKVPASGFRVGAFPDHWTKMHQAVAEAKIRRYTELKEDLYRLVFQPPSKGGNPGSTCSVCGEDRRSVRDWDIEREEQNRICSLCESFIDEIGKKLPESRFLALGFGKPEEKGHGKASDVLRAFGMRFQLLENAREATAMQDVERITLWALEDPGNEGWPVCGQIPCARVLRYTVNRVPRETFDKLQEKGTGGFKRLGVLRMDVDNLGELFKLGLGELATLARLSTLSFQISLYFEGWVKHLVESRDYREMIYSVYSGGDDLFLIGPWESMPELAQAIRKDLADYAGGNPAFHISGGMAFVDGKYPVYQAAEDALQTLHLAKDLTGKNAFAFLGTAWPWETFDRLQQKQERLLHLVGSKSDGGEGLEGPQAILGILRGLAAYEGDEARRKKGRPVWGSWMWMGAYRLKRMAERYQKTNPRLAEAIEQIRQELGQNDYREINEWGTAARWAQLITRKKANE
jgi:CRISPR-associated protein Csm1